jgi:hypothetical protein
MIEFLITDAIKESLTIYTIFHSVSACIDEDYERIVVMKYERELEAKFGKSRYTRNIFSFNLFFKRIFPLKSACTCWTGGRREGFPPPPHLGGGTGF